MQPNIARNKKGKTGNEHSRSWLPSAGPRVRGSVTVAAVMLTTSHIASSPCSASSTSRIRSGPKESPSPSGADRVLVPDGVCGAGWRQNGGGGDPRKQGLRKNREKRRAQKSRKITKKKTARKPHLASAASTLVAIYRFGSVAKNYLTAKIIETRPTHCTAAHYYQVGAAGWSR